MLTVAYHRVSTDQQTTENQALELDTAGYQPDLTFAETVSGKVPALERPEFGRMLDTLRRGRGQKRLIITKLDRLGRDAADILTTVKLLGEVGCQVRVLQLGDLDLTSTAGKLVLGTLAAVAEMERDILIERTNSGLARARASGTKLGRPRAADDSKVEAIREALAAGQNNSQVAREFGVSRATVIKIAEGTYAATAGA